MFSEKKNVDYDVIILLIQKKVVPTPDYDSLDDTIDQPKAESPGGDTKDDTGISFII